MLHPRWGTPTRSDTIHRLVLLPALARWGDAGLLVLRLVTGAFLVHQTQDNVFSDARMDEFVRFLAHHGFVLPELMARLSVWAQFLGGLLLIAGALTRWAGLVVMVNFIVACAMVHAGQGFVGWWPALVLVVLGLYFALRGSGRYGVDAWLARRWRMG